jgi:hypothetical protein
VRKLSGLPEIESHFQKSQQPSNKIQTISNDQKTSAKKIFGLLFSAGG